jgi:hypothetical protein
VSEYVWALGANEEEEEITSFQPHQADKTTYKQESGELVYLTLGNED